MNKLRYSEMFYSIQGEGRYVGVPSVFLRVFGCNFECTGFGQDRDRSKWLPKEEMPHNKDYPDVKAIEDLPVPHVGCDSSFSWGKKWGHLAQYEDVDTIVDKINSFIPKTEPIHLVLTGGEPLLKGFQPAMSDIILHRKLGLNNITFETNGTQEYHFKDLVNSGTNSPWSFAQKVEEEKNPHLSGGLVNMNKKTSWYNDRYGDRSSYIFSSYCIPNGITWSVSPKLSNSGEKWEDAIRPEALVSYNSWPGSFLYLKFVVRDEDDLTEVKEAIMMYKSGGVKIDAVYLMPETGPPMYDNEGFELKDSSYEVSQLALKYGYKYSPRLQINLFGNAWGT